MPFRPDRLLLITAALWLAGCAPGSPGGTETAPAPGTSVTAQPPAASPAPDLGTTLVAYRWRLESAADASGQPIAALFPGPENQIGLEFADGRVAVTGGCNRISAGYQLVEPAQLQLSPGASTMMACPPPLADADAAIARFLTGTLQAELQGDAQAPALRLAAADGGTLHFTGTRTPETRFGGPGARAFLEVAPEGCPAAAGAAPGCLKVRDRYFDEQGLPSGSPGEWRELPGGIEGYAPTPGQQQVVRVKRFETAGEAGGEPAAHFVFDMVVESRTVP
jgi:heat shock protein HslJ